MIITNYVSCSVFADLLGKGLGQSWLLAFWLSLSLSRRRNIRRGLPRAYASFMFCGEWGRTAAYHHSSLSHSLNSRIALWL